MKALHDHKLDARIKSQILSFLDEAEDRAAEEALLHLVLHSYAPYALGTYTHFLAPSVPLAHRRVLAPVIANEQLSSTAVADLRTAWAEGDGGPDDLRHLADRPRLDHLQRFLSNALRTVDPVCWPPSAWTPLEAPTAPGAAVIPDFALFLAAQLTDPALSARLVDAADTERSQRALDMRGGSLRPHLLSVVRELAAHPSTCRDFLHTLHQEQRRLDVVRALKERKKEPSSPVARAVYRGCQGKRVKLHLCILASGVWGLLFPPTSRYKWFEGTREELVALVPEQWFDAAVSAAATAGDSA